jgi:hypothetical protein
MVELLNAGLARLRIQQFGHSTIQQFARPLDGAARRELVCPAEETMPYAEGRVVHDADSHVVETPEWFEPYADPPVRARMDRVYVNAVKPGEYGFIDIIRQRRLDPTDRAAADAEIMIRKNWSAMGSFVKEDRPRALDLLGFSSQLVFNTFHNRRLRDWEHGSDPELAIGAARAHNRGMVEFCSVDKRLLPTCYVPLFDWLVRKQPRPQRFNGDQPALADLDAPERACSDRRIEGRSSDPRQTRRFVGRDGKDANRMPWFPLFSHVHASSLGYSRMRTNIGYVTCSKKAAQF